MSLCLPEPPTRHSHKPLPIEYDWLAADYITAISALPTACREMTLESMSQSERSGVGAFVLRGSSLAVSRHSVQLLSIAAKAFALNTPSEDIGYDLMRLSVVKDASNKLGEDFTTLMTDAARCGTLESRQRIFDCLPNKASIAEMAFELVPDGNGFRYKSTLADLGSKRRRREQAERSANEGKSNTELDAEQ